jgi:hypothetical protein
LEQWHHGSKPNSHIDHVLLLCFFRLFQSIHPVTSAFEPLYSLNTKEMLRRLVA